ncbi:MAG: hypothetical protein QXS21_01775 [Thermoproteota archaeon]|nr:hypothetical protein [Candidatus Brockarchaeota archaeon]MBO3768107.1 hypothetical protein [Candidatus Brockarchaeota archaeon]MBO3800770.1 hypothetical protein [Candidatus Brockarchaeota archaeon]
MAEKSKTKFVSEKAFKKEVEKINKKLDNLAVLIKSLKKEVDTLPKVADGISEVRREISESSKQLLSELKSKEKTTKKPRKLSEMNIFVRDQIKAGKTFAEAIKAWKEYKASKETAKLQEETKTPETPS